MSLLITSWLVLIARDLPKSQQDKRVFCGLLTAHSQIYMQFAEALSLHADGGEAPGGGGMKGAAAILMAGCPFCGAPPPPPPQF